jgi:short-subunit dehydrogenase
MSLENNVVVITGASTGIGEELAYRLARKGAHLMLAARRIDELERVAAGVRDLGARVAISACDVAIESDCKLLMERTVAEFGGIDSIVLNAGVTMWAKFADIRDMSIVERIMRINYLGAVYCTHYALPHLVKSKGRILGVSSLTGITGVPTRTAYAASKHAMRGFFDSLRIELAETGVSVTMVYPGFVATGIRENATAADGKAAKVDPVDKNSAMSVEECAAIIVRALEDRRREEVMTAKGKLGQWLKLIAPAVIDAMAKKAVAGNQRHVDSGAPPAS